VELSTADATASNQFYAALFGWRRSFMPRDDGSFYTLLQLDGKDIAAFQEVYEEPATKDRLPGWRLHIATDNLDRSLKKAIALGGRLLEGPSEMDEVGRFALLADSTGAVFVLREAHGHIGAEVINQAGALAWQELATSDCETAKDFYGNLFEWQAQTISAGARTYTKFKTRKNRWESGGLAPLTDARPPGWMAFFAVDDCDKSVSKARTLGAHIKKPPADLPGIGRCATLEDPQGAVFSVVSLPEPSALLAAA
jgi:hypothetical protein